MLELAQNSETLTDICLTPSYLLKETFEISDSNMSKFMGLSLAYLREQNPEASLEKYVTMLGAEGHVYGTQSRDDWNISDKNIQNELDRCNKEDISFYVVLRWLQYEINSLNNKKADSDDLLSVITNRKGKDALKKLTSS